MKLTAAAPVEKATIQRALLSVSDKADLLPLARALAERKVEILASGGTAQALATAGLPVVAIETFTKSPEVLGGRVKTLHPRVHAGILAHRGDPEHVRDLQQHDFPPIDLVVCNLYPFAQAIARGAGRSEAVENIDIGGPTLVRAAAKNADGGVSVLTDPADYAAFLAELAAGGISLAFRRRLQAKAFRAIAAYDLLIADWIEGEIRRDEGAATSAGDGAIFPAELQRFTRVRTLRYGENPHQRGALYVAASDVTGVGRGVQLAGKELSYTNYLDMDAAYRAVYGAPQPACAIIKHTNPCGFAFAATQPQAFERALAGDPVSAFGSVIGFDQPLTGETARAIRDSKLFVECLVAPDFTPEALTEFRGRENLRLVKVPAGNPAPALAAHRIGGGLLVQETDPGINDPREWRCVTKKQLAPGWLDELAFAMRTVALLKSNAIAVTKSTSLLGLGTGQTSRVDSTEHALEKAGNACRGAFLASDAFFPFDDSVRLAAKAGIVAVVQPGGSKRDDEVIAACDELGIAMVFTGRRHFRH